MCPAWDDYAAYFYGFNYDALKKRERSNMMCFAASFSK
jgi:hypothetical protein